MIKGMTGFGTASFSDGTTKGIVEVKSVNHRYLDINFYLPIGCGSLENKIRAILNRHVKRGKVIVSVKITQKAPATIFINKSVVRQYLKHSRALQKEWRLENTVTLADLIKLPGVVEAKESLITAESAWPLIEKSLSKSLGEFLQMRKKEGKSLVADIDDKLKRMRLQIKKIRRRAQALLNKKKKRLNEEEFLSYQKGCDINEEIERLSHYVEEVKKLLTSNEPVGKKMDFIAQEMQRETNTMGSKLQDKIVSNAVISLKSKIEKIREQSQNIE